MNQHMSSRSVSVSLRADIGQFTSAMAAAGAAVNKVADTARNAGSNAATGMGRLAQVAKENEQAWNQVSGGLLKVGTVGVAGLGLVTKAAMDWESSWAGVTKTVEGTPQQLGAVEDGLRGLAKTLPASHTEIAAVAEAAGQLGIAVPNIVSFTRTMIDLGETTNLSANEAATSLARFMNIMGTSQSDVSRLGSTLVELGNNFATTEGEIMAMSMRLAGVGNQVGLTEGEVMGLAAAMSSVGIEAEAGGTAMSTTMKRIDSAAREGGEAVQDFADVAGMSAEDFAAKWRENPAAAMDSFVQGLARVKAEGGNVSATLDELGIKGIREQDTLLRLAGAADLMGDAFASGNEAFAENSALVAEAAKRYETTESQIRIAWNNIKDAAITAGAAILPVVSSIADGVVMLADAYQALPGPVRDTLTGMLGFGAVAALALGSGMKLVSTVGEMAGAFRTLGVDVPKGTSVLSGAAKAVGLVGAAFLALQAVGFVDSVFNPSTVSSIEDVTNAMLKAEDATVGLNQHFQELDFANGNAGMFKDTVYGIESIGDALYALNEKSISSDWLGPIRSLTGTDGPMEKLAGEISQVDKSLASMVSSGNLEGAGRNFADIAAQAEASGVSMEDLAASFPELGNAVTEYANSLGVSLSEQEKLDAMMGNLPPKLVEAAGGADAAAAGLGDLGAAAEDTAASLEDVVAALRVLGEINMTQAEATGAFHESLRGLNEALQENAFAFDETNGMLDTTTEGGYAAQQAFNDLARAGWDMAEATANAGGSLGDIQGNLQSTYDGLVNTGTQFGLTGEQAETLARNVMGIPDDVSIETWMGDTAQTMAETTGQAVEGIPGEKGVTTWMDEAAQTAADALGLSLEAVPEEKWVTVSVEDQGSAEAVKAQVDSIQGKQVTALVTDQGTVQLTQAQINGILGKSTKIAVSDQGTVYQTQGAINGVTDGDATIFVDENGVGTVVNAIAGVPDGNAIVHVSESGIGAVQGAINSIQGKTVYVDVIKRTMSKLIPGLASGGRVPGFAAGGVAPGLGAVAAAASGVRLPTSGPGTYVTDGFMGVSGSGMPVVRVDAGEWITNAESSHKYNRLLGLVNADHPSVHHLRGYADGRRPAEFPAAPLYQARATAEGGTGYEPIDYGRLAEAMSRVRIDSPVTVDNRTAARIVGAGERMMNRGR